MDQADCVVGEQGVGSAGEFEVMGDVVAGLGWGEWWHGEAERDSLVERGEHAELDPPPEGGLSDEQTRERGSGVEFAVGQEPDFFELVGGEEVGFVDRGDDAFTSFVFFGGEQVNGLWDQRRFVESGDTAERGDDAVVDPAGPNSRVPELCG